MTQPRKPKRKRTVPKTLALKDDREVMDRIFGKRIMRRVNELVDDSETMRPV